MKQSVQLAKDFQSLGLGEIYKYSHAFLPPHKHIYWHNYVIYLISLQIPLLELYKCGSLPGVVAIVKR